MATPPNSAPQPGQSAAPAGAATPAPAGRVYSTPVPPADAPDLAARRKQAAEAHHKALVERLAALSDKLGVELPGDPDALAAKAEQLAPDLGADDLALLNAAVTELQAEAQAAKAA